MLDQFGAHGGPEDDTPWAEIIVSSKLQVTTLFNLNVQYPFGNSSADTFNERRYCRWIDGSKGRTIKSCVGQVVFRLRVLVSSLELPGSYRFACRSGPPRKR